MKKVAIIGTAGVPGRYGGFETLAHNLVLQLGNQFDITVYNSKKVYKKEERVPEWHGAKIVYLPLSANGLSSILYDIISMIHAIFYADILLILGVSGGIFIPFIRLFSNKKLAVNIDGLEWKREKWHPVVRKFLHLSEILAVKFSHATITDNAAIQRYAGIFYKTTNTLIAYGSNHAHKENISDSLLKKYKFLSKPYAFSVARIEPENNVHIILKAFSLLPNENLVFIGNWKRSDYGKDLLKKYDKYPNIHLLDPIYDQKVLDQFRSNCQLYLHGHSAGGTNPSLVEAMYLELPIFAFNVQYNRATTKNLALYFSTAEELKTLIKSTNKIILKNIASEMLRVALQNYTWNKVANEYKNIFLAFNYNYSKKPIDGWIAELPEKILVEEGLAHLKWQRHFYEPYNSEK